jgi:hypothetical protein
MTNFAADSASDLQRHNEHFPSESDLTLQVLKGHLLVEELLRELFILQLQFPAALKGKGGTSLDCHRIICLVQAITPYSDKEPWIWLAARKLNKVRNNLAHKLSHENLGQEVANLIKYVMTENQTISQDATDLEIPKKHEFELVIMSMCTCLSAFKAIISHQKNN